MAELDPKVTHNHDRKQFEINLDGQLALAAYRREGSTITFTHTEVPPEFEGRGIASKLIRSALDEARDEKLKVVAQCEFVSGYIKRHPEYETLTRDGRSSDDE